MPTEVKHPMQPVMWVGDVIRFKKNAIVRYLLDSGPIDMNAIAMLPFTQEDREQFAQLIGYSVDGFATLGYASEEVVEAADKLADELIQERDAKA